MKKINGLGVAVLALILVFALVGCEEPSVSQPQPQNDTVINISAIQGVTLPASGSTPVTTITENAQYSGTVTWSDNPATFAANKQYTATITLTPKSGYTLQGVAANFFTVDRATSVSNDANSGVITAVFPMICSITVDMFDSGGDGWGNTALRVSINGTDISPNVTLNSGYSGSYVFNVATGDSINVSWISGDYDTECSFIMYYTDTPPNPEFNASNNTSWNGSNALVYKLRNSNMSGGTSVNVEANSIINISAIKGVTVPVKGGVPVTTITESAQYTGTVTWVDNPNTFAAAISYTAIITLTPKKGYTLQGVTENFFTVAGATTVTNAANSGVITAVFPETDATIINSVSLSITAPVKDATPTSSAISNSESGDNFTIGQVSWLPAHNPFRGETVYTASVTLTAHNTYTFTGLNSVTVNGQSINSQQINNTGKSVTLSYTFPATYTKIVTNIAIKTQPTKFNYTHGDTLDLTGLVLTLTFHDGSTEDVPAANFTAINITATPAQGNSLAYSMHNGHPVKITYGSLTVNTDNLTVNKATPKATDYNISGIGAFNYDGSPKTVTIAPKEGKSNGNITVKYNGNTTAPSTANTYTVTFDVTETTDFIAVNGLSAGTLIINKITPKADDFNINGIGSFYFGSSWTVSITPKDGKTDGKITIKYNGSTAVPSAIGTYTVTFDVAAGTNYNAVTGYSAGTLTIKANVTPTADDFIIETRIFAYDGNPKTIIIKPKNEKSDGKITVKYNGITTAPSAIGTYAITFDVAAAIGFNAVNNLYAGTLKIVDAVFNSISSLNTYLQGIPANTADTPYIIALNVNNLGGSYNTSGSLGYVLNANKTKYVSIDLSDSTFTGIENNAFCTTNLIAITIPDSVTSIALPPNYITDNDSSSFNSCTNLTVINVDSGNTKFSSIDGVLYDKNKTTLIRYPQGKKDISFTIPDSVTSITNHAFGRCTSLTSVTIPDSVTTIRWCAFYVCTNLTSVTIGNRVTGIYDYTFASCTNLKNVTIGNNVTDIGYSAFYRCTSLTSVIIPDSVTYIGECSFDSCTNLTSVTIGNSVTIIEASAFSGCKNLVSVNIPDSVTSFSSYAFDGCTSLAVINVGSGNTKYSSIDGVLYNKDITNLIIYPYGKTGSYSIPDSVIYIEDYNFNETAWYKNQPDGLVYAGKVAYKYKGNGNMPVNTSITLRDDTKTIAVEAFWGCTNLASITIPDSVTFIGRYAFRNCRNLISITIGNGVTSIEDFTFVDCTSLTSVTIPDIRKTARFT